MKSAVFARSAKFSAKFTERGGAASGMKTPFPKCHPYHRTRFKNSISLVCFDILTTYLCYIVGAVFRGDLGVSKSKLLMDRRRLLTTDFTNFKREASRLHM